MLLQKLFVYPQVQVQLQEKKTGKESQYIVSRPGLDSDPPFGSDRESGCDILLIRLFSFPCFEFQVVRVCWVGVPASFVALLVLSLRRVVMRASIGLRIEGRSAEESALG